MDQHLSDSEIERYLDENALASDQERVHGHMAACPSCFATWRETSWMRRESAPVETDVATRELPVR